jgi:16S rRNA (guanine966-N2)-methyltransferase
MRVIAGRLGGRTFNSPQSHRTHPMSDKIRGALFNTLGDLSGLTVLDAFAGSGALSFEAISRGAQSVLAIESDRAAQRTIAENIKTLDVGEDVKLISTSANGWLQTNGNQQFDVVLLDPPYDDVQAPLLQRLATTVNEDGILVLSWPGDQLAPSFENLELIKERAYGDAHLIFYRRTA